MYLRNIDNSLSLVETIGLEVGIFGLDFQLHIVHVLNHLFTPPHEKCLPMIVCDRLSPNGPIFISHGWHYTIISSEVPNKYHHDWKKICTYPDLFLWSLNNKFQNKSALIYDKAPSWKSNEIPWIRNWSGREFFERF